MAEALQAEPHLNGVPKPDVGHESGDSVSHSTKHRRGSIDRDAQEMVIDSLRAQIQDLFSQVSQLNNKLVKSYDRVSDLEDELHVASANVRTSSLKISQLELERTQHLSALNTGLLVEKSHVTTELNRLMEKATEEAAQRGQAESARMAIEKDLDDLSASLFGQANSMVAEARFEKHLSERKVEDAERALKSAEEAVQLMQMQMQAMQVEREEAEKKTREMEQVMGKGVPLFHCTSACSTPNLAQFTSNVDSSPTTTPGALVNGRFRTNRTLRSRTLSKLAFAPFCLDCHPFWSINNRTDVCHGPVHRILDLSRIHYNCRNEQHHDNISCALCGTSIFPVSNDSHPTHAPVHLLSTTNNYAASWSGSFFRKSSSGSVNGTQPSSPTTSVQRHSIGDYLNSQVFIFRLASLPTSAISSLPIPSLTKSSSQTNSSPVPPSYASSSHNGSTVNSQSGTPSNQPTTIYPLCMSGWCLHRLRTTCTLWAFIRTGIVDKIWEEEIPPPPPPPSIIPVDRSISGEKPPIPPRKRGLWGIASAIGERAASWSGDEKEKIKKLTSTGATPLPPPPPPHPSAAHAPHEHRRLPPPLPPLNALKPSSAPPPLPKRSEGRGRNPATNSPTPRTSMEDNTTRTSPDVSPVLFSTPLPPAASRASTELPTAPLSPIRGAHLQSSQSGPPPIPPRTHTPSNVPLPESRPGTPSAPSRTTSPAIALSAGGAPPPIPRRAAARARATPGGTRPSTPANTDPAPAPAAESEPAEDKGKSAEDENKSEEEAKVNGQVEDNKVEAEPSSSASNEGQKEDSTAENKVEVVRPDRSTQPSPTSDLFVDAPTPGDEVKEFVAPVQDPSKVEEKMDETHHDNDGDEEDKATVIEAPVDEKSASAETIEQVAVAGNVKEDSTTPIVTDELTEEPVHVNGAEERVSGEAERAQEEKLEEEKKQREKEEKYKTGYVGDATWDEKTWKELVRLREDMFWARVGGFKD
ncbi:hypothetical protein BDZ97DRAFT_1926934 [Flammula alnicola]|nr:hypothetical protein BDZ97DRAFT_1926934 [Flammula alnicola]